MELLDIYDENRNIIDVNRIKGKEKLKKGEYYLSVEALLINSLGNILISKRAETKPLYPGYWEINGGGCQSGETSLDAIVREIKEELGIDLKTTNGKLLKTVKNERRFKDVWCFKMDINIEDLKFTDDEVTDAKWVRYEEFKKMKEENILIDTSHITEEDYNKTIKLLNIF